MDMAGNYPSPGLKDQAGTALRMVWKGLAPDSRAVTTVLDHFSRMAAWCRAVATCRAGDFDACGN